MEFESIDLSKLPKSFTTFLISMMQGLDKLSVDEIIDKIKGARDEGINVSQQYIDGVVEKIDELKENKRKVLKYIADIALKGSDLGVISSDEQLQKIAEFSGVSKDEIIVNLVIASKKKADLKSNFKNTWDAADGNVNLFMKRVEPFVSRYLQSRNNPKDISEMRQAIDEATDKQTLLVFRNGKWTVALPKKVKV